MPLLAFIQDPDKLLACPLSRVTDIARGLYDSLHLPLAETSALPCIEEPEELEECEWLIKDDTELLEELLSPSMAASQVRQGMGDAKERAASRLTRRERRCMMLIIGFAVALRRCQKVRGRK